MALVQHAVQYLSAMLFRPASTSILMDLSPAYFGLVLAEGRWCMQVVKWSGRLMWLHGVKGCKFRMFARRCSVVVSVRCEFCQI